MPSPRMTEDEIWWPSGLGGTGASAAEARRISAALATGDVIPPPTGNGPSMGGPTVLAHGSEVQKARFVAPRDLLRS